MSQALALVSLHEETLPERLSSLSPTVEPQNKATPVHYVVTCRQALLRKYGPQGFARLDGALTALAEQTPRAQPTAVRVVYADDAASLRPYGIWPATPGDANDFKRVIEALHAVEGKDAEIPTVLLVGGDDIVPFFRWTHPTDGLILTDAPYAATGDAIFAPVRAVGRWPDAPTGTITSLLHLVTTAIAAHEQNRAAHTLGQRLRHVLPTGTATYKVSPMFACAAHYWQEAAREVCRAVGDPPEVRLSPPGGPAEVVAQMGKATLLFFALGGSRASPDWWGHHDPRFPAHDHPYPIALRPENLHNVEMVGTTVFTTAGFAGEVVGHHPHTSLALQCLAKGANGVIASTGRVYGSLALPLMGADLLARYFIEALGEGQRIGHALTLAKVRYARDMLATQGYLDLEDQQTLLGFTLFGDPSLLPAQPIPLRQRSVHDLLPGLDIPGLRWQLRAVPQPLARVPLEVQRRAFDHAAAHLPHMADAPMSVARPILWDGEKKDGDSFMDERFRALYPGPLSSHTVFTFSQAVNLSAHIGDLHRASITVSPRGELLKMIVSR